MGEKEIKKGFNWKRLLLFLGIFIPLLLLFFSILLIFSCADQFSDYKEECISKLDEKCGTSEEDIVDMPIQSQVEEDELLYIGDDIVLDISFENDSHLIGRYIDPEFVDDCYVIPKVLTITHNQSPEYSFVTVNRDDVITSEHLEWFEEAYRVIKEKDINSDILNSGYLQALKNYCFGGADYLVVSDIEGVNYPNTDYVFGVFSLGGYQDGPFVDGVNFNYLLSVYAIKGDNLIQIDYMGNTWEDFGVQTSVYSKCVDEDYNDIYDINCVGGVFSDLDLDSGIDFLIDRMLRTFAIN